MNQEDFDEGFEKWMAENEDELLRLQAMWPEMIGHLMMEALIWGKAVGPEGIDSRAGMFLSIKALLSAANRIASENPRVKGLFKKLCADYATDSTQGSDEIIAELMAELTKKKPYK